MAWVLSSTVGHCEQSLRSAILIGLNRKSRVVASNYSDEVIVHSDTDVKDSLLFVADTVDLLLPDPTPQVRREWFLLPVDFSVIPFLGALPFLILLPNLCIFPKVL